MKKIDFVFFDAGGGHRSAANALKAVAEQQQRPWRVRLVNLQETLDAMDVFRKMTGIRMQDIYNNLLARGWTFGSEYLVPPMHGIIRMYHTKQVRMLGEFWKQDTPDLVVSVVPNFNRALLQGLRRASARTPFVTVITDIADYPPHFWIERQEQYIVCGSERAAEQAREHGHPPEHIKLTSGMILRPMFYGVPKVDRAAERLKLGLQPDAPTGLVLFGGQGSKVMLEIAERLRVFQFPLQLIFLCGRNEKLAAHLRAHDTPVSTHVAGFTNEVPYFMQLSDFFIGKPGPGSISEALAMHLPVIVERNAWTLPQERYNTDWVLEKEVGIVLPNFNDIERGIRELLQPSAFGRYKANAAAIQNRAVFEIPEILASILEKSS